MKTQTDRGLELQQTFAFSRTSTAAEPCPCTGSVQRNPLCYIYSSTEPPICARECVFSGFTFPHTLFQSALGLRYVLLWCRVFPKRPKVEADYSCGSPVWDLESPCHHKQPSGQTVEIRDILLWLIVGELCGCNHHNYS